jgi:hypothetical protein
LLALPSGSENSKIKIKKLEKRNNLQPVLGEERKMSLGKKMKINGKGANAKTDLYGCSENAAPKWV